MVSSNQTPVSGSPGGGPGSDSPVIDGGPVVELRNAFNLPYDDAIAAARTCYSPRVIDAAEITAGQRERIGPLTYDGGHHTVFTHATFEFSLSGISRQLVWCFLHAFPFYNTEQQSQRYVKLDEARAHVPVALEGEARRIYEASVQSSWAAYRELTQRLEPITLDVLSGLWRLKQRQSKAFGRNVHREAEKKAIETARYVIPIGCHTAMVYTVSGITLHRLRRMAAVCDVPTEARLVVDRMVDLVRQIDPAFFDAIGEEPLEPGQFAEDGLAAGPVDPGLRKAFDDSLAGRSAKLVDHGVNAPAVVADAVRHVLGRADLSDADALAAVLDPARNPQRLDTLDVGVHSPLLRALNHASYTFRKKLSHTADSQDQRHRMIPGSRPQLTRTVGDAPDVIEPDLIAQDPACHALFEEAVGQSFAARRRLLDLGVAPEHALYLLPNALALRFEESGSLLHLLHKWTMRTCFNAQREIFEASMDEIAQVREVHPELMGHVGPPCSVRNGHVRPRCSEGSHFCGVPVWRSFPDVKRQI